MKNCSGSDDGGSKRRQRDILEGLLAGQLVEDQLAWGPTPGRTVLICRSHRAALKCCDGLYGKLKYLPK
jgi:hypothetical protein